jgi:hypothetical protein
VLRSSTPPIVAWVSSVGCSSAQAASGRGLASVFGDAVTVHPFSQRAEHSHGYRETALQLGMVPAQTTMSGFGGEGPRRRTATLRSYRPLDERPRRAALPALYRELLESIYVNVGLSIEALPEPVPVEGEVVTADIDEPRLLGFLRLQRWDGEAATAMKRAVRHLLSLHVDVVYADVGLVTVGEVHPTAESRPRVGHPGGRAQYSSCRRIHTWNASPSSRPLGVRSRIP